MRVEVVRMIADWLANADYGVNAMLAEVPRDVGDAQPPNVTIADETRDSWVARGVAPKSISDAGPYIAVAIYQEMTFQGLDILDGHTWQPGEVPVALRYIMADVDSDNANLMGGITMRAARWSLNLLRRQENSAARVRNLVRLDEDISILEVPVHEQLGDAVVTSGLLVRCNATDAVAVPV